MQIINLRKQFCSYEISLKLKDLGFNEECLLQLQGGVNFFLNHVYLNNEQKLDFEDYQYPKIEIGIFDYSNLYNVYIPLWQQVIDWLFDNHNIIITRDFIGYKIIQDKIYGITYSNHYNPYTKETAILKAIELIIK